MESLEDLQTLLVHWVRMGGPVGLLMAMIVENLVQVVPSLAILPLAGTMAAKGLMSVPEAIACSTLGSVLGCLIWYTLGRGINEHKLEQLVRRHGRWLGLTPGHLRLSRRWFRRHEQAIVCWGRMIPVLRTNVSLPAGMEMMPCAQFLIWSSLGITIWNSTWISMGYLLNRT